MTDQFDVVKNKSAVARQHFPYLLVLQHPFLEDIKSVVVAPLTLKAGRTPIEKLIIESQIDRQDYLVLMYSISTVDKNALGTSVANLSSRRDEIIRAYDLIISGI